jgi:NitT/TauT family transport system substrate-binding protein
MRRKVAALMAAPLLLAVACGGSDEGSDGGNAGASGELDQVTVGVIPIVDVAPIYLGADQGFFEDQGIDLTLEAAQGGAAIVPGVVSGDYQFGFSNVTSLLVGAEKGLPLQVVANGVASTGEEGADFGAVVTSPDSGITDAADLAGKRIAVNTLNNIGTTTVNASIRAAGGDPSGVQYVELPFPDMPAALDAGNVDAIWVVEPFLTIATNNGATFVASNFVDAAPDLTVATYFTSKQLAGEDADLVERFTTALEQSLEFASKNPDETRAILSTYTEIDQAVIDAMTLPAWPTEINRDSIEQLGKLSVEDGLLEKQPDLDALLP